MKSVLTILWVMLTSVVMSQAISDETANTITTEEDRDKDEDNETDDDYDLQQLEHYRKHPININSDELRQIAILDPVLLNNLSRYRRLLGDLIDLHELQAVPGFSIDVIKKILPYITIDPDAFTRNNFRHRLENGDRTILARVTYVLEKAKGFVVDDSLSTHFIGSRPAVVTRYKYQYRNLLQYGFITDKDAGEKILAKNHLPQFISFHLFIRQAGIFKSVAIGDFAVNMGQGLIQWQSQAFGKNSAVINTKRQSDVLRPYNSAGEYNFNRGAACTIGVKRTEVTMFASKRKLSANISDNAITSLITSGLNRTTAELNDYNTAGLFLTGASLKEYVRSGSIAFNAIHAQYSLPVSKRKEPYTIYSLQGTTWSNYSIDYNYTYRNFHFFGEAAIDKKRRSALVSGVLASLGQKMDLSLLYRRIDKSYQAVFGNAFTESTAPTNEEGLYAGLSLKPFLRWQLDIYADAYRFSWLRYRLDAPAVGSAYLAQITFRPSRRVELYTRIRTRFKPLNIDDGELTVPDINTFCNWRTHLNIQLTRTIIIRSRLELSSFNKTLTYPQTGYLFYTELLIKPPHSHFSGNARFQAFEAGSYDARIYTYESDVLFVSSTPSYYNNGMHYYFNLRGRFKVNCLRGSELIISLKMASTVYTNISTIGTGVSSVAGNRSSTVKLLFFLAF